MKSKESTERLGTKYQSEKLKKNKEEESSFSENYRKIRNNFVEEKKTSFMKNE